MKLTDQAVKVILETFPNVIAIYLFGSFGTKFATAQSDVDLAILAKNKIDKIRLWKLSQAIAIQIDKDVDLIDLKQVSTILQFQIINENRRLYCQDEHKCNTFENIVDAEYLNFRQLRADLIADIKKRGRITDGR